MKFGKLTIILAALSSSALMHAEIKLKIGKEVLDWQKRVPQALLQIKIDKNKGFCYQQPSAGQHCNENDIALDSLTHPEDRFNFDKWYEPGKLFNKVETIQWKSIWRGTTDSTCQAIVEDGYTRFSRESAPNAEVEFGDSCRLRIFNPKTNKYLPTVSFILNEKTGEWEYASFTPESGVTEGYRYLGALPDWQKKEEREKFKIFDSAKAKFRELNSGK